MFDKVDENIEALRDSRCSEVIARRELVENANFIGVVGHIITVDQMLKKAPFARVEVDTLFYSKGVDAMCIIPCLTKLLKIFREPGSRMI